MFLRYRSRVKGYKLYHVNSKQVFLLWEVVFHEDVFLFHTVMAADQLLDRFLDLVLLFRSPYLHQDSPSSSNQYSSSPIPSIETHILAQEESLSVVSPSIDVVPDHNDLDQSNNLHTDIINTPEPTHSIPIRHSKRASKRPKDLRDYHCNLFSQKPILPVHLPIILDII